MPERWLNLASMFDRCTRAYHACARAVVSDFEVVVDGEYMEEAEESYSLFIDFIQENNVAFEHIMDYNIQEDTAHSISVEVSGQDLMISEITVKGMITSESEPQPETDTKPRGIPGFPLVALTLGIFFTVLFLWMKKRTY